MRYVFLIYVDERASAARSDAEIAAGVALHAPYIEMLRRNGKYAASDALFPTRDARTLRSAAGKPIATDGPFAESREQLGGYYVVDAADLDEAIALAGRCPAFETVAAAIEIRPAKGPAAAPLPAPEADARGRFFLGIYGDEATAGGRFVQKLAPASSATTLRRREGSIVLSDGPFADGDVELAGYAVVRARDIGEAAGLAFELAPAGAVEIRPIRTPGD